MGSWSLFASLSCLLALLLLSLPLSHARPSPSQPPDILGLTVGNSSDPFHFPVLPAGAIAYSSDPLLSSLPTPANPFSFPSCHSCGLATSTSPFAPPSSQAPSSQYAFLQSSPATPSPSLSTSLYGLLPSLNYTLFFSYALLVPPSTPPFSLSLTVTANSAIDPHPTIIFRVTLNSSTPWTAVHPLDHFWPNANTAGLCHLSFTLSPLTPLPPLNLTLLLSSVTPSTFPPPTPLLDLLVLGDPASEAAHALYSPLSLVGVIDPRPPVSNFSLPLSYPTPLTYRQPTTSPASRAGPRGSPPSSTAGWLNVTLAVHPSAQTYLTLKLYGSDHQAGVLHVYITPQAGDRGREWVPVAGLWQLGQFGAEAGAEGAVVAPLSVVDGRGVGSRPRRFCFATTALPLAVTRGRTHLIVLIGGYAGVEGGEGGGGGGGGGRVVGDAAGVPGVHTRGRGVRALPPTGQRVAGGQFDLRPHHSPSPSPPTPPPPLLDPPTAGARLAQG